MWMYGWFRASSTEMRHSGSMTSILDSRSRAWLAVMATGRHRERERCTVRSVTVGKRGGRYFSLEAVSRSDYFPICDLRQHRREGQDLLRQITKHDAGHGTSDITTECLRRQTLLVTRAWKSYSWLCRALSRRGRPSRGRGRPSWRQSTAACSSHSSWQSPSVGS